MYVATLLSCSEQTLNSEQQDNLEASGSDLVYSQALMAVIGALALEQGSAVANRIAREKVLFPLGLKGATSEKAGNPQPES